MTTTPNLHKKLTNPTPVLPLSPDTKDKTQDTAHSTLTLLLRCKSLPHTGPSVLEPHFDAAVRCFDAQGNAVLVYWLGEVVVLKGGLVEMW